MHTVVQFSRNGESMNRDHSVIRLGARAIDVGYYNVKFTVGRKQVGDSNPIGTEMFPALAPMLLAGAEGEPQSPSKRPDGLSVKVDGVDYFVGKDVEFYTRGGDPRGIATDYCLTSKYMALMHGALHYIAENAGPAAAEVVIGHLVVGLPLNTYSKHRASLAQRITGEHVIGTSDGSARRVTIERAYVIPQPQGALYNFGLTKRGKVDGWTLVVDPGGGTLDWYVASKEMPNFQRSGAYPKAMLACAYAVADRIDPEWKDQYQIVNRIDSAIRTGAATFAAGGTEHELAPHKKVVDAILEESVGQMLAKVGSLADIDQVLLTGGGAKVLGEFLVERRPELRKTIRMDEDPVYSNVRGFHVYGELQHARQSTA